MTDTLTTHLYRGPEAVLVTGVSVRGHVQSSVALGAGKRTIHRVRETYSETHAHGETHTHGETCTHGEHTQHTRHTPPPSFSCGLSLAGTKPAHTPRHCYLTHCQDSALLLNPLPGREALLLNPLPGLGSRSVDSAPWGNCQEESYLHYTPIRNC